MFKKKLNLDKYLFLVTICILINLLESWYFGLNWQAVTIAEKICDWITTIPFIIISFWFFFSNDYIEFIKGYFIVVIMLLVYGLAYGVIFM